MKRIITLAAALVLPALVLIPSASASGTPALRSDTSDFVFESFDADYTLSRDSAGLAEMRVVETLVALFPDFDQNRGIYRTIPRYYQGAPLDLGDFSVTDENGDPVYFTQADVDTSYDGSNAYENRAVELTLGTDDFVHGRTTYVISYTAHNVVGHFADSGGDELYWDVNGDEWQQSFGRVSATVHVDESLTSALTGDVSCYSGYYGSAEECELSSSSPGEFHAAVSDLGSYSNLTFAIGFDGGTFVQPDLPQDSWVITRAPLWLLYGALGLLFLSFVVRFAVWRDARGRGIIVPQYTTPDDRDLLEAGDLVEREGTAMAAQFVDLAVRGLVQVVDLYPGGKDFGISDRFALDFVTMRGATPAEQTILNILFDDVGEPGERVQLTTLDASTGAALYGQRAKARRDTTKDGRRAQPAGSIDRWLRRLGWLIGAGYIAVFVWTFFVEVDFSPAVWPLVVSIVVLLIASGLLVKPYLLTETGAESRDYLLGMRDYLTLAEEDRMRVLQSPQGAERVVTTDKRAIVKLHEKLLPYAVLWGVEKQWSRQLEVDYSELGEDPSWLNNSLSDVNLSNLMSSFTSNSMSAVRPIVSSSSSGSGGSWSSGGSSSFSSGSSGGGFSGGGGGGGGGGGR